MSCDNVKPKHGEKAKLCYRDTDNFVIYIKTKDNLHKFRNYKRC